MEHKQYVNGAALGNVRYSGRLPTAGTAVFYGVSKQHKYHTIYILKLSLCNISSRFHLNKTFTHKTASHRRSGLT